MTRTAHRTQTAAASEDGPDAVAGAVPAGEPATDGAAPAQHGAAPAAGADADVAELSALTLPLMWSLRQAATRAFEPLGLRPTRVLLLELVARGIARPGTLADVLDTVPPAVTAMLNELTARGLLERDVDPDDRRRTRLRLTPFGEATMAEAGRRWIEASRARFEHVPLADRPALLRALRVLASDDAEAS